MITILDTIENDLKRIQNSIPEAALYEQLAEECSELAQAALKKARKLRKENPTPKTMSEIDYHIIEEFVDVILCADVIGIEFDESFYTDKLWRWIYRNEKENLTCQP